VTDPVDAALALAAERRWRDVGLADIASRAGLDLAQLRASYASKPAILAEFVKRIDIAAVAGSGTETANEPVRDRLLEALLRRIEALSPHKQAVASIARDSVVVPGQVVCAAATVGRSMRWTLESAGASPRGALGILAIKTLSAIYLSGLAVWLREDDPGLSRTMAHLDRRLRQAERLAALCGRFQAHK
jgi:AcrR family transcriptional regulator